MQLKPCNDPAAKQLFEVILKLQNIEECFAFFEDLCTAKEIESLSQRLLVAKMLQGGSTYLEIDAETGASTAIISRVKRCLYHGNGSYTEMLNRVGRYE
ncbi:YerC/YecD family TrpR-related protein [Paenibacillus sp. GCM10027628]|uniref:YerC/YecD family TrpR-related protein n=1 Tax=Paenibacillus sp. GCM10027628 TaxID=3273413 RepID=UPI00362C6167